ncbi:DUF6894 family protein [Methylobacterium oxalidis]|uniref:DUF6894 family protein n=1 Tax=Methylobacterium oxalidis TaxID=944322 RepID=UPI0033155ACB
MPRYFFNLHIDQEVQQDDTGTEFKGLAEVRKTAQCLLPNIARDEFPGGGDRRSIVVLVTDQEGRPVYSATLDHAGSRSLVGALS